MGIADAPVWIRGSLKLFGFGVVLLVVRALGRPGAGGDVVARDLRGSKLGRLSLSDRPSWCSLIFTSSMDF